MEEEEEDSVERVFRDISNASENLTSLKYKDAPALQKAGSNLERQLYDEEERLKRSGLKYADLEAKYRFLEGLKDENWPNTSAEPEKNNREDQREITQEVKDLENGIDELAETLLKKHDELKEKLKVIEKKLATSKTKRQQMEFLEEESREMANKLEGLKSSAGILEEVKQKQSEAGFAMKQCDAAINSLEHSKTLLQGEVYMLQEHMKGLTREVEKQDKLRKQSGAEIQEAAEWFTKTLELFGALGGITVKFVHDDSIVLEINPSPDAGLHETDKVVELTIQFKLDATRPGLLGAKINTESFQIDDLICEAQRTNDVVELVRAVKARARSHLAALAEIEELQTKYAADWEPTMGRVRVMLGTSGKIVCTLKVSPLHPHHVTLLGIEDTRAKTELPVADFQFAGSPPSSLSSWIERLDEQFTAAG